MSASGSSICNARANDANHAGAIDRSTANQLPNNTPRIMAETPPSMSRSMNLRTPGATSRRVLIRYAPMMSIAP